MKSYATSILLLCSMTYAYGQESSDTTIVSKLSMITSSQAFGAHYRTWAIQYREFEAEIDDFVIPVTLSFGNTRIKQSLLNEKGIKEINSYALGLGFDGYEYLGNRLYFNLGVGIQPGAEIVFFNDDRRATRFLLIGTVNSGLLFVPFSELGIVLGAGIRGRVSNSKGINHAVGWGFEVGINF